MGRQWDYWLVVFNTGVTLLSDQGHFPAFLREAEKRERQCHDACQRTVWAKIKKVYRNDALYMCSGFCGVKRCKGGELVILAEAKKGEKDAQKTDHMH